MTTSKSLERKLHAAKLKISELEGKLDELGG